MGVAGRSCLGTAKKKRANGCLGYTMHPFFCASSLFSKATANVAHPSVVGARRFDIRFRPGPINTTWKDEKGSATMELPQGIDSKFRFILVAAKRAHQLIGGAKARVQSESKKVIVIAQREVSAGLVPFMMVDGKGHDLDRAATVRIG